MSDELPQGWVEVALEDVGEIVTGNTPPKNNPANYGNKYPWAKPPDLNSDLPITKTTEFLSENGARLARLLPEGATLVSCIGILGKIGYAGTRLATNQQINSIIFDKRVVDQRYGFHYCKTYHRWLEDNSSSTTVAIVNKGRFSKAPFRLAPLPEQQRIIVKLEKLLAKVDTSQIRMAKIPTLLKRFRQSILAAAFSGRLTADWRNSYSKKFNIESLIKRINLTTKRKLETVKDDYLPQTWLMTRISDLYYINPGHEGIRINDDEMVTFLPMSAVEAMTGRIDLRETKPYGEVKRGHTKFIEGDVLFAKITPCMENGKLAIATGLKNSVGCGTTEFHVFREIIKEMRDYLYLFLGQDWFREFAARNFQGTSGHLRVPINVFDELHFPLPPLEEQEEIVRRVKRIFAMVDKIEARYQKAQAQVEKLTRSILAKAFQGELVPQDPNDEPAEELLKRIKK